MHVIASTGACVITPKRNSDEESTEDDLDENKEKNKLRLKYIENTIKELRNEQNRMTKLLEKFYQAKPKTSSQQKLVGSFLHNRDFYSSTKATFCLNSALLFKNQNSSSASAALTDFYSLVVDCSDNSCYRSSDDRNIFINCIQTLRLTFWIDV